MNVYPDYEENRDKRDPISIPIPMSSAPSLSVFDAFVIGLLATIYWLYVHSGADYRDRATDREIRRAHYLVLRPGLIFSVPEGALGYGWFRLAPLPGRSGRPRRGRLFRLGDHRWPRQFRPHRVARTARDARYGFDRANEMIADMRLSPKRTLLIATARYLFDRSLSLASS